MDRQSEAAEIFQKAERAVRDLLLRVVSEGDYELATILSDCARQMRMMCRRIIDASHARSETLLSRPVEPSEADGRAAAKSAPRDASRTGHKAKKSTKLRKTDYPRFYREGDDLVKIGWSKKRRAEYRHKAPWPIVQKVVQVIEEKGSKGTKFLLDDLLPVTNQDGGEIPSYQVYLVVAWLKREDLIVQHGRRGYTVQTGLDLADQAQKHWSRLSRDE